MAQGPSKSTFLLLFLFVFIEILGFSIILPLFPYLVHEYEASPVLIGCVMAANALAQFVGAPFLGRLSDLYGRRPVLLVCIASTLGSFLLLAFAQSMTAVFLSRVLDGILGGNIALAQAYITDVTGEGERTRSLGLVGAAFGLGFIVGPALGGTLVGWHPRYPALAAALLSFINLIGAYFLLTESLTAEKMKAAQDTRKQSPSLGLLLGFKFAYNLVFTMFESTFSLYNKNRFGLTARQSSYVLCFVALLFAMLQGGGITRLTRRISEARLIVASFFVLSFSLFFWALASSIPLLLLALVPFSLSSGALNTLINSLITKHVKSHEIGGALGITSSVGSLTRVIAPVVGSQLLQTWAEAAPGLVAAAFLLVVALYARARLPAIATVPSPPPTNHADTTAKAKKAT
ncbi:transporter, major facilitator subfamily protein [Acanthamoeba castellanii str. Neff]|uniref:Transporter, major facilitator subfamily protein n=1 Tax=Acanthamoeba castellanii (strain ATCC 30010 / Neff) TaxID=1257118 RepID=L8GHU4_ACACF|nr:transporter, major facilitator subfamily protein [Acanthamoeba castellanii str. Neff]ELR12333.1 transporter, major facilitator subfamily protein [Acanthamoeba castellanii str. Neff]